MQTYLFYDIETTGLNKSFDQVLHFAAIRTDLSLKELERYELKVKLNAHIIPSPEALITHHMGITEIQNGITELDAITQIHRWLNAPGTISVGYNSLGFDDEFLRFSFFRHLLPAYTHQYANQCSRMDLYPMAILFYLYKNDIFQWPIVDGQPKLKLELINAENQWVTGQSHHAMVDVEVTLAMARCFFAARDMWDYAIGYFNKQTDLARSQPLPRELTSDYGEHREGLMLQGRFGSRHQFQRYVLGLGESIPYKNQTLWLPLDSTPFHAEKEDTLVEQSLVTRKKWGEPAFILPPKDRFMTYMNDERRALIDANKMWLKQHPALFHRLIEYHRNYTYPVIPNVDCSASLYLTSFLTDEEKNSCQRFHAVQPEQKSLLVDQFRNPLLKTLALRLLGLYFPQALTPAQHSAWIHQKESEPWVDYRGEKKLTAACALRQIAELRQGGQLSPLQSQIVDEFEDYLLYGTVRVS